MTKGKQTPHIYFSDYFNVSEHAIDEYGAFNISLLADLPLFIDPFLLFNSRKKRYRQLHDDIIAYLKFLRDKSTAHRVTPGLLRAWYRFPEIRQTWLGFSRTGNRGSGLGPKFGRSLHDNLHQIFKDFGSEEITQGSHVEKLCLIKDGVGKDNISDLTTNLIQGFLCEYTQAFAREHIARPLRREVSINRARFNYRTESWERRTYDLPWYGGDHVLLTPRDVLTRDDTWINKSDLIDHFRDLPEAIPNEELRAQINNYFLKLLPKKPKRRDERSAAARTILEFPQLIDYYIRYKEDRGETAKNLSSQKVSYSKSLYVRQFQQLAALLDANTAFYALTGDTYLEAQERVKFLKDVIENKGGHRIFYSKDGPIEREEDVHILYRLTWYATASDVSREVDDGRGPADFKISRGSKDKTIVEFKLAKNTQLKRNLQRQAKIYEKASDAKRSIKVIIYFSEGELDRVNTILKELKQANNPDIVLIDARRDNKPSGSRA